MKEEPFVLRIRVYGNTNPVPKKTLPKKFLSVDGRPTQNALMMYLVYLTSLPIGWNLDNIHEESVKKVRQYFGVDYGFDTMIMWGIWYHCTNSKTSKKRHEAMSKAFHTAVTILGKGFIMTDVKLP